MVDLSPRWKPCGQLTLHSDHFHVECVHRRFRRPVRTTYHCPGVEMVIGPKDDHWVALKDEGIVGEGESPSAALKAAHAAGQPGVIVRRVVIQTKEGNDGHPSTG